MLVYFYAKTSMIANHTQRCIYKLLVCTRLLIFLYALFVDLCSIAYIGEFGNLEALPSYVS